MITDAPNINHLWAGLLVEELVRGGVDFFFLAPGSRSTPLVTAIAAHPMARHIIHFDERGTAFAALGYARATGRAAAWVTTSGTAVANGLPAVVEAATDGVPLLLLTADRPPELRKTGANQTIEQAHIFGEYVRWHFDLPAPTEEMPLEALLTVVDQALYRAARAPQGPVHLNLMFREPLAPVPRAHNFDAYLSGIQSWLSSRDPYTLYAAATPSIDDDEIERVAGEIGRIQRGVITVGKIDGQAHCDAVIQLAEVLGWPILPDVGSHLRIGETEKSVIPYYDQILLGETFSRSHRPEAVFHVGGRLTSKRLLQFIEQSHPRFYVSVREDPSRLDPAHRVTHAVESDPTQFCMRLAATLRRGTSETLHTWSSEWQAASRMVSEGIEAFLSLQNEITEPAVARIISQQIPSGYGLCLASSMPIRDMDMYADPGFDFVRVAANRGASGIDGTIATAAGFACGLRAPVTLFIGDLAFLHDLNSLAMLKSLPVPVIIVVVNNDGGGIFSFLPIARFEGVFEPYFGTPHGLSFEHAAALFGIRYEHPATPVEFARAYTSASEGGEPVIIEVTTDRKANYALHQDLQQRIKERIEDQFVKGDKAPSAMDEPA